MAIVDKSVDRLIRNGYSMQSIYHTTQELFNKRIFAEIVGVNSIIKISYKELDSLAKNVASYIQANKFPLRIGIYAENSPYYVAVFWGILMSGHEPVLMNTKISTSHFKSVINDSKIEDVFIDEGLKLDLPLNKHNISNVVSYFGDYNETWCDKFVVGSSGTTGQIKSFVFDGKSMVEQIKCSIEVIKKNRIYKCGFRINSIKLLAILPLYHIFGLITLVIWYCFFGRTLVFPTSISPSDISRACILSKVTHFFGVPMIWDLFVNSVKDETKSQNKEDLLNKYLHKCYNIQRYFPKIGPFIGRNIIFKEICKKSFGTKLCVCISGGATANKETLQFVNSIGYNLFNGYGSSEMGVVSVETSKRITERVQPTCGKFFHNIKHEIRPNGSLLINAPTLYSAILMNGDEIPRPNGFFEIGDCVSIKSNDKILILGRLDDIIIGTNGENISPDYIEQKFKSIEASDYCVIGENGKIILVININSVKCDNKKLYNDINKVNSLVRTIERITEIRLVDIPLHSETGKVRRNKLYEMFRSNSLSFTILNENENDVLINNPYIMKICVIVSDILSIPIDSMQPGDDFFANLGGESLQYFELINQISREYNIQLRLTDSLPTSLYGLAEYIEKIVEIEKKGK